MQVQDSVAALEGPDAREDHIQIVDYRVSARLKKASRAFGPHKQMIDFCAQGSFSVAPRGVFLYRVGGRNRIRNAITREIAVFDSSFSNPLSHADLFGCAARGRASLLLQSGE